MVAPEPVVQHYCVTKHWKRPTQVSMGEGMNNNGKVTLTSSTSTNMFDRVFGRVVSLQAKTPLEMTKYFIT